MGKLKAIEIDLNSYNLVLRFPSPQEPLVLHFDTPSRRFYLSIIALITIEMKKQGKPRFIYIRKYKNELKMLDEFLSGKHASKDSDSLLAKIRVAWRNRLPDLETATLFKVQDRDRIAPYEKGGKYRYECSDMECDLWANLFSYDDHNKWRFKFAIDSAALSLDDISIIFEDRRDNSAWDEFMVRVTPLPDTTSPGKKVAPNLWKKPAFVFAVILIVGAVALAIWNFYPRVGPLSTELPDKPSIAVLPFKNMSGDPEQQYFSDGITEQIITSISKVPYLFVIARQSSFAFRDKQLTIQQIAKELGVRYILEGSLQRSGERLRINVQLIDATTGHHLWAENYDRKLDDIFAIQDDICKNIMVALQVKLTTGEVARIYSETASIRAYEKYLKAMAHIDNRTKEDSHIARKLFQEAIALDSEYASAYIQLGFSYVDDIWLGMTKTPSESLAKAEEMVKKVTAIEGKLGRENVLACYIHFTKQDYDKAIYYGEKSVEQFPNNSYSHNILGAALRFNGQFEEAISSHKKALQLNPVRPIAFLNNLAWDYLGSQQYEKAISTWNEAVERNPDYFLAQMGLTVAYWVTGQEDRARQAAKHVLRINPKFTVGYWKKRAPGKDKRFEEQVYDAWRKAGLPE